MRDFELIYDKWQLDFIDTKGDKILCSGRQVGKTEACAKDAGDYAINNPESHPIVMIAPTERQAYGLFVKTLNYLARNYPKQLMIKGDGRPTKTRMCLKDPKNFKKIGVEIYCLPVGKDGLGVRFLTIGRLYKDECSRIPEAVHEAIDPALLTTGGDEILLSTPFGAQGTFYEIWINKDGAYDSFSRFSITSEKVMAERPFSECWTEKKREKALNKLNQAKSRWSKRRYAQEYLGEFVEGLHRWFSDELIDKCCVLKRRSSILRDRKYVMGNDIARMGEDEGTFEILDYTDIEAIEQVENVVTQKKYTTETEDRIVQFTLQYNLKMIYIDAGAGTLGVSVLDHLQNHPTTRNKIIAINNAQRIIDKQNDSKTKVLKQDLYDNLRALMERGQIKLLDDEDLRASLMCIQYEYIMKDDSPTRLKIFGTYSHIAEGLIRAAWCSKSKHLNLWASSVSHG